MMMVLVAVIPEGVEDETRVATVGSLDDVVVVHFIVVVIAAALARGAEGVSSDLRLLLREVRFRGKCWQPSCTTSFSTRSCDLSEETPAHEMCTRAGRVKEIDVCAY
jgi:hypothetical protein